MKRNILIVIVACTAVMMTACRDRAAEKKIAELESRLAEVEKNSKGSAPANNPNATNVRSSSRKAAVVPLGAIDENHHARATGLKMPNHSYQVQLETKK